ncbi:MAG: fumarylacetoacetate hydrolase family protein [Nocardioides sp.]|nr:fumarylacetoacetate hydrolase family protein [Nocardioides sp.]
MPEIPVPENPVPDSDELAAILDEAVRAATAVPQLSLRAPLDEDEAYAVQSAGVRLRAARGDQVVGVKLGFTSKAKAEQMGVADVIVGVLHQSMEVADEGTLDVDTMIHPRIEPEVAFRLGAAVDPHADPDSDADIVAAAVEVAPAMEIIDSRYENFKFSLADVVADNTSAAAYVIGLWRPLAQTLDELDLAALEVALSVDGTEAARGSSADILGDPLLALAAVKRMAREHGLELPAGSVILAGAATAAVPLEAGVTVTADLAGLGRVSLRTGGGAA